MSASTDIRRTPHRLKRSPADLEAEAKLLAWGVPERKLTRASIDEVRALLHPDASLELPSVWPFPKATSRKVSPPLGDEALV